MTYQALARKYRPQHFSEVVGQAHAVKPLVAALDQSRLHHAFLFTGTRGVGKTTIARLLAKAINCQSGMSSEPCGTCTPCLGVEEGRFIDLIEIDAASRTRVDDTREILENVQYAPTQGRCKVYIIDEVHMLSTHSFNALLKTLEEPPEHVKFLLATTDPEKLPATILSRCLQFNLRAIDSEQIEENFQSILRQEAIDYEELALKRLSQVARGSMRDGLSLLDQAIAFGDGKVTDESVRQMLGMIDSQHLKEIVQALSQNNAMGLVTAVQDIKYRALDYNAVLDDLLLILHDIVLYHVALEALEAKGSDVESIGELADAISVEDAQYYYQIGLYGKRDQPLAPDPSSGLEMTLLRMIAFYPGKPQAGNEPIGTVDRSESVGKNVSVNNSRASSTKKQPRSQKQQALSGSNGDSVTTAESSRPNNERSISEPEVWASLINRSGLKGVTRELAMNLAPLEFDGQLLKVNIAVAMKDLHNQERQAVIEKTIGDLTGTSLKLYVVQEDSQTGRVETPAANNARHAAEEKAQAYEVLIEDPTVKQVIARFEATVVPESVTSGKQGS